MPFSLTLRRWIVSYRVQLAGAAAVCALAVIISYFLQSQNAMPQLVNDTSTPELKTAGQTPICTALAAALPENVLFHHHQAFKQSAKSYWSQNAREYEPACIVRPTNAREVAEAVKVLKASFDASDDRDGSVQFAVRSGGHSPEAGFANIDGGVLIDLGLINEVQLPEDRQSAIIGAGARWLDVSSKLDTMGLAVVGGRDAHVGVGGLALGGGISFFSPRYGMVCDNILAYEIVLANGSIAQVTERDDLWRALKGGSGNFGIVTRVTARAFASEKIWAGYGTWFGWQTPKLLRAFVEFNEPENFDEYAAGPILSLAYVQNIGMRFVATSLVYTKPQKWPPVFAGFKSLWRLRTTTKIQSVSNAMSELSSMAPSGKRQFQVTTTVRNDLDTLNACNDIYTEKLREVKGVKGSLWTFTFQPLSTAVTRKGAPNVLGLGTRSSNTNDTLIIVLVSVSWVNYRDDELVQRTSRSVIAICEKIAEDKGTADRYRYLNYAASGQDPFTGYGSANKHFLQAMSKKYDPDAFFQKARHGGFKLDVENETDP